MAAEGEVVEQYLPLVRHIVFQVATGFPRHVDREELARAGALGLMEAAQRWDDSRGVPFARFAAQRIRGAILDAVRATDWAPRSVRSSARTVEEVSHRLAAALGRHPTAVEMADALDTTTEELARLQDRIHRSVVLALDRQLDVDGDDGEPDLAATVVDTGLEPSAALEQRELHAYVRDAVGLLPERHRLVIVSYFLEGRSSSELAAFLGVTESRVSQLRSEALALLRGAIAAQYDEGDGQDRAPGRDRGRLADALSASSPWRDRLSDGGGSAEERHQ